jgi:arylsulfatase A-like enzyme
MERGPLDESTAAKLSPTHRRRPSKLFSDRIETGQPPLSGPTVWALCGWIGLVFGLIESGVQWTWRQFEYQFASPDLWVNWQGLWMTPLSLAIGFVGLGLVLGLFRTIVPRTMSRLTPRVLIALGVWSILGVVPGIHPWIRNVVAVIVAIRVGRMARFDSAAFRRFARSSFPALACLWLMILVTTGIVPTVREAWSLWSASKPSNGAPNVLLVVLDTVRADNLSLQGYERPTTPRLSEWAARGVRFDQARATSPYTLGTHASLFTGHWMSETSARVNAPLDAELPTLAEHFRDRGYATGGFVGNIFYGSAHYGLDRGFLHYLDIPDNLTRKVSFREFCRSSRLGESLLIWFELKWRIFQPMEKLRLHGDELNREALDWVDQARGLNRPFFMFMNYFDAHSPYSLPGEAPQPYSRLTADRLEARMKRLEQSEAALDAHPSDARAAEVTRLQAEVNTHLRNAYDDGISWIDRKLDELLKGLEGRGLLDETLIVITADHGEMLGEHEVIGHGKSLDRQVVHVPLLVIDPRSTRSQAGRVVTAPVSVRDIPATILDLVGDPQANRFPGQSLRRYWSSAVEDRPEAGLVLSEMEHLSWRTQTHRTPAALGPLWLLTEAGWSYHRQDQGTSGTRERLFNIAKDPDELMDLANDPAYRTTLERLRKRFDSAKTSKQ